VTGAGRAGTFEGRNPRRHLALALLCVAQFVDVLDVNAVIVALPTLPTILSTGTVLIPRGTWINAPSSPLASSNEGRKSEQRSFCNHALIRRRNALRRTRSKSLSTCSSRLMYRIIGELLLESLAPGLG
jgi:hypothetical protein